MKRLWNTVTVLMAVFFMTAAVTGCGSESDDPLNGVNGLPPGYVGGVVQQMPGGAAQIAFNGANVYDSGINLNGFTPGFYGSSYQNTGTLSLGAITIPMSTGILIGTSLDAYASNIQIVKVGGNYPGSSNISGIINLGAPFVQAAFYNGTIPQVLGLAINLSQYGGNKLAGQVRICTSIDAQGCHGAILEVFAR